MNILVIPTTDWLKHPTPHRHHYLVEELKKNHNVFIMYFDIFKREVTWEESPELIRSGTLKTENLAMYYALNAPQHFMSIRKAIREKEIDVVFAAHLLPSLVGFYSSRSQKNSNRKILNVYDFSDFFPESAAVYYKSKVIKNFVKSFSSFLFKLNLEKADLVTTVSLPLYNQAKEYGASNVELITNGVDVNHFKPNLLDSSIQTKLNLGEKVIGFVGSIERWLDFETVIFGFREVVKEVPDAKLLIVGGSIKSDYFNRIQQLAKELKLENEVVITGFVPYAKVPYYMNLIKVAVIPFRMDLYMARIALPDKLFEYLACGKEILSTPLPEVIRVSGDSINVYRNKDEFVKRSIELLNSKSSINIRGIEIAEQYNWSSQARKLERIFGKHLNEM